MTVTYPTALESQLGWQVPVRQVGEAVPLHPEQPATPPTPEPASTPETDRHDEQEPEPAGTNNVIPMHPEPQHTPTEDDEDDEQPTRQQHTVDVDPPPTEPDDPAPGGFSLRHASMVGYCMSVGIAAIGQILALAAIFGGTYVAWIAAVIAAAFAEVTMIGAGSWSLELRKRGHPWKLLMVGAGLVCGYAVGLQGVHYAPQGVGQAAVFAGASAIGWSLHMAVEHVRVASYLRERSAYEAELAEWRKRQQPQQPQRSAPSTRSSKPALPRKTAGPTRAKTNGASKQGKPKLTPDVVADVVHTGRLGEGDGPAALRRRLTDQYVIPADSTVKRWIAEARKARTASA